MVFPTIFGVVPFSTYNSGFGKWHQMLLALDVPQQPSLFCSGSCTLTAEHPLLRCCWTMGSHGNLIPVKFVKKACVSIWPHLFMVPFLLLVAHADRVQPWPCPVGQREYHLWAVLDPSSSQFPSPIWLTRQGAPGGQSLTALVGVFASAKVQAFHACNSTDPLHWRTWGHNPVFVCYTSRLCLHLFKGDWLWSSWDVRRCS